MGPGRIAAFAVIVGAAVMLGACVSQSSAPVSEVSPALAVAPPEPTPAAGWQWSDAGPAVFLNASDVTAAGAPAASLSLICNDAVPAIMVAWNATAAPATSLAYRFDGQTGHDVSVVSAGSRTQMVTDPIAVSRFIDEAAASRQLVLSTGATQATFSAGDAAGNLSRFRTVCPDGTN